jgi:hypothetical protein
VGKVTRLLSKYLRFPWTNGVRFPAGNLLFSTASRPALGHTQPLIQWVSGALSLGVKWPGREAHHTPSSAEVEIAWCYTSTPSIRLECQLFMLKGLLGLVFNTHIVI